MSDHAKEHPHEKGWETAKNKKVQDLVDDLSEDDRSTRSAAQLELGIRILNDPTQSAVVAAIQSVAEMSDPEVSIRVQQLLQVPALKAKLVIKWEQLQQLQERTQELTDRIARWTKCLQEAEPATDYGRLVVQYSPANIQGYIDFLGNRALLLKEEHERLESGIKQGEEDIRKRLGESADLLPLTADNKSRRR